MLKIRFTTIIKSLAIIFLLLLLLATSEVFGFFKGNSDKNISVPYGSSLSQIANALKEEKLIGSETLFKIFAYNKVSSFKAGNHTFSSGNYFKIISELETSPISKGINITIPEGYEQREIALLLEKNNICSSEEFNSTAKLKNFQEYWFLNGVPKREYELEGYLFPDTYTFGENESVESIIKKMLDNFDSKITEEMKIKAQNMKMSFDDIVIMASIVEREAAADNEYKKVSGVFYNRMKNNPETAGFLQSCATVQYILKERRDVLTLEDTKIDSPYNTYKYKGLPQGPIASPGIKTIEAALYPENTDYLYFVADGDGRHYFAVTYDEHQKNMRKAGL